MTEIVAIATIDMMTKSEKEITLGYTIGRTNWYIKTLLNKLLKEEGFSITNEQWVVLKVIAFSPGLSQTEIAEKSLKDKTNITRILDLLEKHGYIERQKDDRDRRMYRIYITKEGRDILQAINPITRKLEEISIGSLSTKKQKELIDSLDGVCNSIKNKL